MWEVPGTLTGRTWQSLARFPFQRDAIDQSDDRLSATELVSTPTPRSWVPIRQQQREIEVERPAPERDELTYAR